MNPRRLVLDTNVLVSALLFRGGSTIWLREAWQAEAIIPLVSRNTASELLRVLSYPKFALDANAREDLLADYLPWCETVVVPVPPPVVPNCRDAFDQPFLELALAGGADALVTGDSDLLALAETFRVPIFTPAEMKGWLLAASALA
ncbi:MAG: putative toxin-antitoxin system toxin component, PIN family [Alphaproteobacteria bacterium]|nr:putative toxin-antitoxin system toxin component, PIN family [Alphaproteobacteria bacterium]